MSAKLKNGLAYKDFQKAVSNLKKSGLVPKKLDVRKVQQTKHYTGLINKFKDVAEGKAILAPINNTKHLDTYSARGDQVIAKGKQLFLKGSLSTNAKGEITNPYTMRVDKNGNVIRRYKKQTADGNTIYITQKELPIKFENMEQWLNDLKRQDYKLKEGDKIIFKLFGNYSRQAYTSFDQAFNKFMTYDAVIKALDGSMQPDHVSDLVRSVAFEKISGTRAKTYNRDRVVDLSMQFAKSDKKSYKRNMKVYPKKPKSK